MTDSSVGTVKLDLDDGDVRIKASSELGGRLYVIKLASWVQSSAARGRAVLDRLGSAA